jgi:hypothetical protein
MLAHWLFFFTANKNDRLVNSQHLGAVSFIVYQL